MGEQALEAATIADKAVASNEYLGLLHGVPSSIKDAIDTAGHHHNAALKYSPDLFLTKKPR